MVDAIGDYGYNKGAASTLDGSASLTGFPTFVRLEQGTDSTGTGPGGLDSNASINGQEDIGFFDENGNPLDFYFVTFDTTNGIFEAWVRTDLVRDGNLDIQVGYGSGNTVDTVAESTLWENVPNLIARWSLNESSGNLLDSTSNNHDFDSIPGAMSYSGSGVFGNGVDFSNNSTGYGATASNPPSITGSEITLMAWLRREASNGANARIFEYESWNQAYSFLDDNGFQGGQNQLVWSVAESSSSNNVLESPNAIPLDTWEHYAGRANSSTQAVDVGGSQAASQSISLSSINDPGGNLELGGQDEINNDPWNGGIDEVQLYNADKGEKWSSAHFDMSPNNNYGLFSWNASTTTDTVGSVYEMSSSGVKKTTSNGVIKTNATAQV